VASVALGSRSNHLGACSSGTGSGVVAAKTEVANDEGLAAVDFMPSLAVARSSAVFLGAVGGLFFRL